MAIYGRKFINALAAATSANGTVRNGTAIALDGVQPVTLSVACTAAITTSSVVATFTPQVSMDGTTWFDIKLPNNASNVTTAAGTGSPVTTTVALIIPDSIHGWMQFRVNALLSGASTGAADQTTVTYRYVQPGGLFLTA
jgi:hypothetical protein